MNINGIELTFDLDDRIDYERFEKSYKILQKKLGKSQMSFEDMENFLMGCINQGQVTELLKDGKITTLTKVFIEFFDKVIDQYTEVAPVYTETAERVTKMKTRIDNINKTTTI